MAVRKIERRRRPMRQVTVIGERVLAAEEAQVIRLELSRSFRERQQQRLERRVKRLARHPERLSVAKAMFAVEQRIVLALWTLHRLPNDRGIGYASRNGIDYMLERAEQYANAVAAGGWLTEAPRPSPPTAKAIDAMHEPLSWLSLLDRDRAKLLTEGAMYRRGDMARNISWNRIKERNKQWCGLTVRTLQRRYEQALRDIVSTLTEARMG